MQFHSEDKGTQMMDLRRKAAPANKRREHQMSFTGFTNKTLPIMIDLKPLQRLRPAYVRIETPRDLKIKSALEGKVDKKDSLAIITLYPKREQANFSVLFKKTGEKVLVVKVYDGMDNVLATYRVRVNFVFDAFLPVAESWY